MWLPCGRMDQDTVDLIAEICARIGMIMQAVRVDARSVGACLPTSADWP